MRLKLTEKEGSIILMVILNFVLISCLIIYPIWLIPSSIFYQIVFLAISLILINSINIYFIHILKKKDFKQISYKYEVPKKNYLQILFISCILAIPIIILFQRLLRPIDYGGDEVFFADRASLLYRIFSYEGKIPNILLILLIFLAIGFFGLLCFILVRPNKYKIFYKIYEFGLKNKKRTIILVIVCQIFFLSAIYIVLSTLLSETRIANGISPWIIRYGPISGFYQLISVLIFGFNEYALRIPTLLFLFIFGFSLFFLIINEKKEFLGYLTLIAIIPISVIIILLPTAYIDIPLLALITLLCWKFLRSINNFNRLDSSLSVWLVFIIGYLTKRPIMLFIFILPLVLVIKDKKEFYKNNKLFFNTIWIPVLIILYMQITQTIVGTRSYILFWPNLISEIGTYFLVFDEYSSLLHVFLFIISIVVLLISLSKLKIVKYKPFILLFLGWFTAYYLFFTLDDPIWIPIDRFGLIILIPAVIISMSVISDLIDFISCKIPFKNIDIKLKYQKFGPNGILTLLTLMLVISASLISSSTQTGGYLDYEKAYEFMKTNYQDDETFLADLSYSPFEFYNLKFDTTYNFIDYDADIIKNAESTELASVISELCQTHNVKYFIFVENSSTINNNTLESLILSEFFDIDYHSTHSNPNKIIISHFLG